MIDRLARHLVPQPACHIPSPIKAGGLALLAALICGGAANAQTVLPNDAKPTCTVSAVEFANWFVSGSVSVNGAVEPANSVTFPNIPNCSFYKWSEQMFLWLTSPAPSKYGSGNLVFTSPVFYDVSPPDANGNRTLIPNTQGRPRNFAPFISQLGPNHQPVAFDQTGKRFNVVRPELGPSGRLQIRNRANQQVEIGRTTVENGKPVLLDTEGKRIDINTARDGSFTLRDRSGKTLKLKLAKTLINGRPFFIDQNGNAVPTEQGQADGNVLIAQNGSLVYYALQVNDVYAYFLTGQKGGQIAATTFPTTPAALNSIEAFALSHGKTLPDSVALAIELKSSWIEATGLDKSKYVTIQATIPTYDKVTPTQWNVNGSKQVELAMVGIHVVGSTAGHPEMIWATFEHVDNTRNSPYSYTNNANATVQVPQNNGGTWTFSTTPPAAPAQQNLALASMSGNNIVGAAAPTPIGPSDIIRVSPWGMPGGNAASNTEIISINNSVINQLLTGDVRKNYIHTGSTWTIGGAPPNNNNQVGTNVMANSTMESFFQPSNCFDCHQGNMLGLPNGGGLSHVYGPLKPLF